MLPILTDFLEYIFGKSIPLGDYITVRSAGALILSFVISLLFGERTINYLKKLKLGQHVRDDQGGDAISLKEMHLKKVGTPTMGGILMIASFTAAVVVFADWRQLVLPVAFFTSLAFGIVGFADDYLKVVQKQSEGLKPKQKLLLQTLISLAFALICFSFMNQFIKYDVASGMSFTNVVFPFVKTMTLGLGILFIPYVIIVLAGTTNGVNLTDGLDGLASGVSISVGIAFAVIAYLVGRTDMTSYLYIPYVQGAGELCVLMCALIGSCFGFLWFNCYPAKMFMGDTGSMFIGGVIGTVAILIKQEILILIIGGIFVAESLSVVLQVGSYKLRKKRIFKMAPLHHHFERLGVAESQIIVRFWMVSALLALAGLSTLKLR